VSVALKPTCQELTFPSFSFAPTSGLIFMAIAIAMIASFTLSCGFTDCCPVATRQPDGSYDVTDDYGSHENLTVEELRGLADLVPDEDGDVHFKSLRMTSASAKSVTKFV